MDSTRARSILGALSQGIHPFTGEVFPHESPYQHPDVVRALFMALQWLQEADYGPSSGHPTPQASSAAGASASEKRGGKHNAGKPWSHEEERDLMQRFDAGLSLRQLAHEHGRSVAGIEARLVSLGRLQLSPKLMSTLRGMPQIRRSPEGS